MNKSVVFMFSGQGSQYYRMGKELFTEHPTFYQWMVKMDDMVRQNIGHSIIDEMYNQKREKGDIFNRTLFTHSAIFMVEYSLAQVLLESGITPDYVLGASLGEFTAAAVAEVMKVEDALNCLLKQAEVFETHCENSGMLAIIHNLDLYHENPSLFMNTELASINYHSHFVVSGANGELSEIIGFLKENDIIYQLLPVSFGFHSSYIDAAEKEYTHFLKRKSFNKPTMGYISSLFGDQLMEIPENYFWDVVRRPIQFQRAIHRLEKVHECIYIDLGPSGTLANFAKNNLPQGSGSQCYSIITPFSQELKNLRKVETLFERTILNI